MEQEEEEIIGTTGEIVDLFNKELTSEEWCALAIVHRMSNRLSVGIHFDWSKSIDVKSKTTSQIVDDSVFLNREIMIKQDIIINNLTYDEQDSLLVLKMELSIPLYSTKVRLNIMNSLKDKGLVKLSRYANGEFWELTDDGCLIVKDIIN
jgi:hypothetical protein